MGQAFLQSRTDSNSFAVVDATVHSRRVLQSRADHDDNLAQVCARTAVLFVQWRAAAAGCVNAATRPAASRDLSTRGGELALALLRSRHCGHRRRRCHASH